MQDALSANLSGTTAIAYPSDGKGGMVIAAAGSTSAAGTTTYGPTYAVDSAFNTATTPAAPNGIARGCLITTQDGYYALIDSFDAGAGGQIRVKRWLHKDPALIGRQPTNGQTWTVWTQPLILGGSKFCILGTAVEVALLSLTPIEAITAAHWCNVVDAAGASLTLAPGNKGFRFALNSDAGQHHFPGGRKFCGLIGFKLDTATELSVNAQFRIVRHTTNNVSYTP